MASKDVTVKYEFDNVNTCTDMIIALGILILSHLVLTSYDDILHLDFISTNNDYDNKL